MSLFNDILLTEVTLPVMGRVWIEHACGCHLNEAHTHEGDVITELLDLHKQLQAQDVRIIKTTGDAIFFNSKNKPQVQEGSIEFYEDIEAFAFGMDTSDGQGIELIDEEEMEGAMEIYEIDEADWVELEDFNAGKSQHLETPTFEFLSEVGVVTGTPDTPEITEFGAECLEIKI